MTADTMALPLPAAATRFRGWTVVSAAFGVLAVGYGTQFTYGVFVKAISEDTGWSRTDLATPYAIYIGLYSFLSGVSGWATDRWGPRRAIAVGAVFLGSGWALLGQARSLWQVYLLLGVVAGIGMSVSWVPCNATVVRWFVRRRGTAVGITSSGGSFGNLVVPPIAAKVMERYGWRPTLTAMGVGGGLLLLLFSRFMIRSPEEVGQYPDGDPAPPPEVAGVAAGPAVTLAEARRTRAFWLMFGIYGMTWLVVFVPFVHGAAFAEDLGASTFRASWVLSAIGIGGMTGRLTVGPLSDRLGRKAMLAATLAIQIGCFVGFALAQNLEALLITAFFFGFSYGGSVTTFPALVGDEFGRRHAGMIVGAIFATAGTVAALGPFAAAFLYDQLHSYRAAFALGAVANLISLAMVPLLGHRSSEGGALPAAAAPRPVPATVARPVLGPAVAGCPPFLSW